MEILNSLNYIYLIFDICAFPQEHWATAYDSLNCNIIKHFVNGTISTTW